MVRNAMDLDQFRTAPKKTRPIIPARDRIRKIISRNIQLNLQLQNEEEITRLMSTVNLRDKQSIKTTCLARLSVNGCPNLNNPVDSLTHRLLNNEPYHPVFDALTAVEMEKLRGDIGKKRIGSDDGGFVKKYWDAVLVVCELELAAARRLEALPEAERELERERRSRRRGVWMGCDEDFDAWLERVTLARLETMESEIERRMRCGTGRTGKAAVEYYEARLKLVNVCKAKACLKEMCV